MEAGRIQNRNVIHQSCPAVWGCQQANTCNHNDSAGRMEELNYWFHFFGSFD
jgi:hypothetical protein